MKTAIVSNIDFQLSLLKKQIGNTPLHFFHSLSTDKVKIYGKLEWLQWSQSVKARAAFSILEHAVQADFLGEGKRLLDATSGNTGIAYASIGAALGIPVSLCLPENASSKRKQILKALGAELIITSPLEGTDGAQQVAKEIALKNPELYHYADQYSNKHNVLAHYNGTAVEILEQTDSKFTHFIAGLGSTGTFTGVARRLKEEAPWVRLIALQPDSPLHFLEGWKHLDTAVIPKIYDPSLADEIFLIDSNKVIDVIKSVARNEGLLLSPSSAASLWGAYQYSLQIDRGVVVTILADDISRYDEIYNVIVK
ncbi:MAG: cysteine synthase family protein [Bacteroidota bacterium]|nr:cysteine synthase family protein [Bacteroidota bacterium]